MCLFRFCCYWWCWNNLYSIGIFSKNNKSGNCNCNVITNANDDGHQEHREHLQQWQLTTLYANMYICLWLIIVIAVVRTLMLSCRRSFCFTPVRWTTRFIYNRKSNEWYVFHVMWIIKKRHWWHIVDAACAWIDCHQREDEIVFSEEKVVTFPQSLCLQCQ